MTGDVLAGPRPLKPVSTAHAATRFQERIGEGSVKAAWREGRDIPSRLGAIVAGKDSRPDHRYRYCAARDAVIVWQKRGTAAVLVTVFRASLGLRRALARMEATHG